MTDHRDQLIASANKIIAELRNDLEKVNVLGRSLGYGQGELDDDLAGCLIKSVDGLLKANSRLVTLRTVLGLSRLIATSPPHDPRNNHADCQWCKLVKLLEGVADECRVGSEGSRQRERGNFS